MLEDEMEPKVEILSILKVLLINELIKIHESGKERPSFYFQKKTEHCKHRCCLMNIDTLIAKGL